jgi:hypothetical protein
MWDLWWKKWHWDRFLFKSFSFLLSVSFHRGSPLLVYHVEDEQWTVGGRSSETQSHHVDVNKNSNSPPTIIQEFSDIY